MSVYNTKTEDQIFLYCDYKTKPYKALTYNPHTTSMSAVEETTAPAAPTPGPKRTALEAAQINGNVKDKVYVITGAYSGIGVEAAKALLHEGGKVVVGGRNPQQLDDFVAKMKAEYSEDQVDGHVIDLGDLASVQVFAKYVNSKYSVVDVLICNAGIMNSPAGVTKNGFESQMGVNVIGHFLLAKSLVEKTKRQVWVSSLGHTMVCTMIALLSYPRVIQIDQFTHVIYPFSTKNSTTVLAWISTTVRNSLLRTWMGTMVGKRTSKASWEIS